MLSFTTDQLLQLAVLIVLFVLVIERMISKSGNTLDPAALIAILEKIESLLSVTKVQGNVEPVKPSKTFQDEPNTGYTFSAPPNRTIAPFQAPAAPDATIQGQGSEGQAVK